jgi:hypothetical protein
VGSFNGVGSEAQCRSGWITLNHCILRLILRERSLPYNLHGLQKHLDELEEWDHVIIPLLWKYRGKIHHRYHLTFTAVETDSGLLGGMPSGGTVRGWN